MGCDIHTAVEVRSDGEWRWKSSAKFPDQYEDGGFTSEPFDWRSYGMFGFLANVRNYSMVPPLSEAKGLPDNLSSELKTDLDAPWLGDHSFSWLSLAELLSFNYDQTFEDRRITVQRAPNFFDGAGLADPGDGKITSFRDFLGKKFFSQLEILKEYGAPEDVRIVFGFDN